MPDSSLCANYESNRVVKTLITAEDDPSLAMMSPEYAGKTCLRKIQTSALAK